MIQIHKYNRVGALLSIIFLFGCSDEPTTLSEIKMWAKEGNWDRLKEEYVKSERDTTKTDQEKEIIRDGIILETFKFRVNDGKIFFLQKVYSDPLDIQFSKKVLKQCLLTDTQIPPGNLFMLYFIIGEYSINAPYGVNGFASVIVDLLSLVDKDLVSDALFDLVNICAVCDNSSEFKKQLYSVQNAFSEEQTASFISDNCEVYWDLLVPLLKHQFASGSTLKYSKVKPFFTHLIDSEEHEIVADILLNASPPGKTEISYYEFKPTFTYLINSENYETAAGILMNHIIIDTAAISYVDFQPIFKHYMDLEKFDTVLQLCSSFEYAEIEGFEKLVLKAFESKDYSVGTDILRAFDNSLLIDYDDAKPIIMHIAKSGDLIAAREIAFSCRDYPPEYDIMQEKYIEKLRLLDSNKKLEQSISSQKDNLDMLIESAKDCFTLYGYIVAELSHNAGISEYEIKLSSGKRAILTTYSTRYQSAGSFSLRVKKFGSRQVKVEGGFTQDWIEYIESNDCTKSNEISEIRTNIDEMQSKIWQNNDLLKGIRANALKFYGLMHTDQDGNSFHTVKIGNQTWMAENLRVTKYRDGTEIPKLFGAEEWQNTSSGAYCKYSNNVDTYGNLYNWYAINDSRNIAPEGWHVPTDAEWKELEMHLGMTKSEADGDGMRGSNEGSKLAGNAALWTDGKLGNNAEFGTSDFSVLPGGYRYSNNGSYEGMRDNGYFWTSSVLSSYNSWYRKLDYASSGVYRDYYGKRYGFSVRCVKD